MKTFLHVGCGKTTKSDTIPVFRRDDWREIRLDIDTTVKPDILSSITSMPLVESESVDAVYSAHNLEHLYAHEVEVALAEFRRVIKTSGFLVLTCPDLQAACRLVAEGRLLEAVDHSPAGPITPLDMIYGHQASIAAGNPFMSHRCGFTLQVLLSTVSAAGFPSVGGFARIDNFTLWAFARKDRRTDDEMQKFAQSLFQ